MSLKQQILQGARLTTVVDLPELASDDFDGKVEVRALTDGEKGEVDEAMVAGQVVRGRPGERPTETETSVQKSARGQITARRIAVAYGLSVDGERWRPDDVAKLPPSVVERLHAAVMELTGEKRSEEEVRSFRGEPGGADDRGPAPDGEPADRDAG